MKPEGRVMGFSKFHDTDLDDVTLKAEMKNIGETPESRQKSLQTLRMKLMEIDGLKPRLDEEFLLRFLRVAKYDVNKAFDRTRKFYQAKKKYPIVFDSLYPSGTESAHSARHFQASPLRAKDNSVILIHKRGLFNPSTMVYEEMVMLDLLILEYLLINPITQICGVTVILDFAGYSLQHFFEDTPRRLHMAVDLFQNTFPMRFKAIHIINAPQIFTLLFNLATPFLTKKIRNRLHVHSSISNLAKSLPAELLSEEYGGEMPDTDYIDLVEEILQKEDYFRNQLPYGYIKT